MNNLKKEMLDEKVWAVSGVTDKKDRFGYKIWEKLKEHGYEVYGVNPRLDELEGEKVYDSVKDIPVKIGVLNMVVNPKIALITLEEAKEAGIKNIFFQPGSYNEEVLEKAEELGLNYIDRDCIHKTLVDME